MTLPIELAESTVPIVVGHGIHKQRYVLTQESAEAVAQLKNAVTFDDSDVRAWLRHKGATLWGEAFEVISDTGRAEAAVWFAEQFQSFLAWRLTRDA